MRGQNKAKLASEENLPISSNAQNNKQKPFKLIKNSKFTSPSKHTYAHLNLSAFQTAQYEATKAI